METALTLAIISAGVALLSMAGNIWSSRRNTERAHENTRAIEQLRADGEREKDARLRQREVSKYSEPLARAAYDLQSRIYNIVRQGLIQAYYVDGSDRERTYVVENTCFLIAQYFCWTELMRRDIQFIDLGENDATLRLFHLQDDISSLWGTDDYPAALRIFAGEQRAIGEVLIQSGQRGSESIGFGAFMSQSPPGANELLDAIRSDIESFDGSAVPRLIALQNALIDLLGLLDPDHVRFAPHRRSKIARAGAKPPPRG